MIKKQIMNYVKRKVVLLTFIFINLSAYAQFNIGINNSTGAVSQIVNPSDPNRMNWIFSSQDSVPSWQKETHDWGMGMYSSSRLGVKDEPWTNPQNKKTANGKSSFFYKTKILNVAVERYPVGQDYVENYTFQNNTDKEVTIDALQMYTPLNDSYPAANIAATNRCHAHVWPGMNSSYVNAIRMNGKGPHLGLVLTEGAIKSYSIENRGSDGGWDYSYSNVRGTIVLNIAPFTLKPGEKYTLQWKLFWHKGWDDFFKIAKQSGFVKVEADRYVISKGEKLQVKIDAPASAKLKEKSLSIVADKLGEHTQKIAYDNGSKYTYLNYYVISSPENLIKQRIKFITTKQQMSDPNDKRYGAYMVYDNDLKKIFALAEGDNSNPDRDEGAERMGMGVSVGEWLQSHQDDEVKASFLRFVKFVRNKLQTPDYKVYSNATQTSRHRYYNYPLVARVYLEAYKLTKEKPYIVDYYNTMRRYFDEFGYKYYLVDLRVKDALEAMKEAGMKAESDKLLNDYMQVGDSFVKTGLNYPKHEVNYEQGIVAPSITFLCDLYLVTQNKKYLTAAKEQLPSLEAFNGQQPDVHLNDIAIRHWDGYWFGKSQTWGDVMPHYWSTLTAVAFYRYYQCTGDETYKARAKNILNNNLLNFKEDGVASCAYIYPETVNKVPAKFYDPYANDQDWALAFYQEVLGK